MNTLPSNQEMLSRLNLIWETTDKTVRTMLDQNAARALQELAACGARNLRVENFAVFITDGNDLVLKAEWSITFKPEQFVGHRIPIHNEEMPGMTGWLGYYGQGYCAHGDELLRHSCYRERKHDHLNSGTRHSILAVPLKDAHGQLRGLVKLENKLTEAQTPDPSGFDELDRFAVRLLSDKVQLILEHITKDEAVKNAIEERDRSEGYVRTLADCIPFYLYRINREGKITYANKMYCDLHQQSFAKLEGKTVFNLYPRPMAEQFHKDDLEVMASLQPLAKDEKSEVGQRPKSFHVIKVPLYDNAGVNVVGIQGIFWDIPPNKTEEREHYLMELVARMMANHQSEMQLYQTVFDSAGCLVFVKDEDSKFKLVNKTLADFYGYGTQVELEGKGDECQDPETRDGFSLDDKAILSGAQLKITREERIKHVRDNKYYWFRTVKTPIRDSSGKIQILGVSMRIDELVELRKERADQWALFQALMNCATDSIYFKDDQKRFVLVNKALANHFGLKDPADVYLKKDSDFFEGEMLAELEKEDQEILDGGPGKENVLSFVRLKNDPNNPRWRARTKMPFKGGNGKVWLLGVSRDVQNDEFRQILDTVPQAIFWKGLDLRYKGWNREFVIRHDHKSDEELYLKSDFDLSLNWDDAERYQRADNEVISRAKFAMAAGCAREAIIQHSQKRNYRETRDLDDRRREILETSKRPMFDENGHVSGVVGVVIDVTSRIEEFESCIREICHTLSTQIMMLEGHLTLLKKGSTQSIPGMQEAIEGLKGIENSARTCSILGPKQELADVNLKTLLERTKASHSDPRVEFKIPDDDSIIWADVVDLRHAIDQLVYNALRVIKPAEFGGKIEISSERKRDHCRIHIRDNGPGYAHDPGEIRARPTGNRHGMGLLQAEVNIQKMGGTISEIGALGVGAHFIIELPIGGRVSTANFFEPTEVDGLNPAETPASPISGPARKTGLAQSFKPTILIIEDNSKLSDLLGDRLQFEFGAEILVAECADDGIDTILARRRSKKHLDLVIVDKRMPQEKPDGPHDSKPAFQKMGVRFAIENYQFELVSSKTPLIIFTAYPDFDDCAKCLQAGVRAYIPKQELNRNNTDRLIAECKRIFSPPKKVKSPEELWLARNEEILTRKYSRGAFALYTEEVAVGEQQAGRLPPGEIIDGFVVIKGTSVEQLGRKMLRNRRLRWEKPRIFAMGEY